MYFPFLRGKQHELFALRNLAEHITAHSRIIPIIEPLKASDDLRRSFPIYIRHEMPFVLLTNPQHGDLKNTLTHVDSQIIQPNLSEYNRFYPGFSITSTTNRAALESFLQTYDSRPVCLVHRTSRFTPESVAQVCEQHSDVAYHIFIDGHTEEGYRRFFTDQDRVLIRDGFNFVEPNSDYPEEDGFSELCFTYGESGYEGFGDFLIIGDRLTKGGGSAKCVAIHLTYNDGSNIRTRHFLSDSNQSTANPQRKYREARAKLITYLDANPQVDTTMGSRAYRERTTFPGLGMLKRFSIMHHIELLGDLI